MRTRPQPLAPGLGRPGSARPEVTPAAAGGAGRERDGGGRGCPPVTAQLDRPAAAGHCAGPSPSPRASGVSRRPSPFSGSPAAAVNTHPPPPPGAASPRAGGRSGAGGSRGPARGWGLRRPRRGGSEAGGVGPGGGWWRRGRYRGRWCRWRDDADPVPVGAPHLRGLRHQTLELPPLHAAPAGPHRDPVPDGAIRRPAPLPRLQKPPQPGEEEDLGLGSGRDPDPLPPRRRPAPHRAPRDPPRFHPQGRHRQTPRPVLRAQTAPRGFLPGGGEPVVRAGGVHGQHGDLRLRRGRQTGQQPQHPQPPLLPPALHAGAGQLHQGPVGGAQRPLQHRHPRQLPRRLPQPPG